MGTYEKPVRQNAHDAKSVCSLHNLIRRDAVSLFYPVIPLLGNRIALEDIPEKGYHAPEDDDDETDAQDPDVNLLSSKAQKEEPNAELDEHHVEDVAGSSESLPLPYALAGNQ